MDRKSLRELTHNAKRFLSLDNDTYKQWVFRYTFLELEKDLGALGDVTTDSLFGDGGETVVAKVVAREPGVLAGLEEIEYFLVSGSRDFRPRVGGDFVVKSDFVDGDKFAAGDVVLVIEAELAAVLKVERVVLNLLARMSGVASFTAEMVCVAGDDVLLAPTRKTLWGWLDKKAVVCGGGGTHRLNLSDAVMVKDNHLAGIGFRAAFERFAEAELDVRFLEFEVENADELLEVAGLFAEFNLGVLGVVLLDNMAPAEIEAAISKLKKASLYGDVLLEASGGINADNLAEYAKTEVDVISMGCLTGGVKGVDFSLEV